MPNEYFLYFEDAELGERVRAAGRESFVVPRVVVRHGAGVATARIGRQADYYRWRNRAVFSRRWGRGARAMFARWGFALRKLLGSTPSRDITFRTRSATSNVT